MFPPREPKFLSPRLLLSFKEADPRGKPAFSVHYPIPKQNVVASGGDGENLCIHVCPQREGLALRSDSRVGESGSDWSRKWHGAMGT